MEKKILNMEAVKVAKFEADNMSVEIYVSNLLDVPVRIVLRDNNKVRYEYLAYRVGKDYAAYEIYKAVEKFVKDEVYYMYFALNNMEEVVVVVRKNNVAIYVRDNMEDMDGPFEEEIPEPVDLEEPVYLEAPKYEIRNYKLANLPEEYEEFVLKYMEEEEKKREKR